MEHFILAVLWILWCVVHSGLISISVTDYLKRRFGGAFRYHRIAFNLTAALTLAPLFVYSNGIESRSLFHWEGYWVVFQGLLIIAAAALFFAGARHYSLFQFLGLRQIEKGASHGTLADTGTFHTTGILGLTRHPWYLGMILIIWARNVDVAVLIANVILTVYLIVGTLLEERKLSLEFGDEYRQYQKRVPMLVPFLRFGRRNGGDR
jgi:protein-S-isoprenylcysteine O-methyltransferase Ste14